MPDVPPVPGLNGRVAEIFADAGTLAQTLPTFESRPAQRQMADEVTATLDEKCPVGDWTTDVWVKTSTPGMERIRIPVRVTVVSPIAVNPETP